MNKNTRQNQSNQAEAAAETPAQHTPGPWAFVNEGRSGYIRTEAPGLPICRFLGPPESGNIIAAGPLSEQQKSNARLIAAAPTLLETCRVCYRDLMRLYAGHPQSAFYGNAAVKATLDAFAKAGVQP